MSGYELFYAHVSLKMLINIISVDDILYCRIYNIILCKFYKITKLSHIISLLSCFVYKDNSVRLNVIILTL